MQILGISESTPKPENRLRSLFWPRIHYLEDVEYIGNQGFWLCVILAGLTFVASFARRVPVAGSLETMFFLLAGVGVRCRSRIAAVAIFLAYLLLQIAGLRHAQFGLVSFVSLALLLANIRGTWLAAQWMKTATEPPPIPLSDTFFDKISNLLPSMVWPIAQWPFYVLALLEISAFIFLIVRGI